jgi:ribose transport system substrate-binding protein
VLTEDGKRRASRIAAVMCCALLLALIMAACGSGGGSETEGGGETTTEQAEPTTGSSEGEAEGGAEPAAESGESAPYLTLGLIEPNEVKKEWNVCRFANASVDGFLVVANNVAKEAAERLNSHMTLFLSPFEPTQQLNQIETALAQNKCEGIQVEPISTSVVCNILTQEAQAKDIPVVVSNQPLCNDKDFTEGTVAASIYQTEENYGKLAMEAFKAVSEKGGGEVGVITGPATFEGTPRLVAGYEKAEEKYPSVKVVQTLQTDFTPGQGLSAAQTLLSAHPNVKGIFSSYDEVTVGIIKALEAHGTKPGDIVISSVQGSKTGVEAIKKGWINFDLYVPPREETGRAVEALIAHLEGKEVPQILPVEEGLKAGIIMTPENVSEFRVED